jgi:hypothetical protein
LSPQTNPPMAASREVAMWMLVVVAALSEFLSKDLKVGSGRIASLTSPAMRFALSFPNFRVVTIGRSPT